MNRRRLLIGSLASLLLSAAAVPLLMWGCASHQMSDRSAGGPRASRMTGMAMKAQSATLMTVSQAPAGSDAEPDSAEEPGAVNTEAYDRIVDNPFLAASINPLSTFSVDVDTASYSNVRRFI